LPRPERERGAEDLAVDVVEGDVVVQGRSDRRGPIVEIIADQDGANQHAAGIAHRLSCENGSSWRGHHQVQTSGTAGQHVGEAGPGAQIAIPGHRIGHGAMADDPNDFASRGIDGFDDHVGMDRQRPLQPGLQRGRVGPVLAEPSPAGQQPKNRPPIGIPRLHHRLGDEAIVDQLVVEGFLTTAAQGAGGRQRPHGADREGEGRERENDLQGQPVAEPRHIARV